MVEHTYDCRLCQGTGVIVCPKCDGGGCNQCFQWEGEVICPDCHGSGKSELGVCVHEFERRKYTLICTKCGKEVSSI